MTYASLAGLLYLLALKITLSTWREHFFCGFHDSIILLRAYSPKKLTGLLTRLSQETRAALPQNCSIHKLSNSLLGVNGTGVPESATDVPFVNLPVIFGNGS